MGLKTWTIKDILVVTADYLKKKGIDNPRLSAEILLARQLQVNRLKLYVDFDRPLNDEEVNQYRSLVKRRMSREPIQYITGTQEFWSMEFAVGPGVLIPRPESEILVEQAILLCEKGESPETRNPRILDLGTGSGVLAICLAREMEGAQIWASDISPEALDTAIRNSRRHGVEERIHFLLGDMWEALSDKDMTFDIIVSNPPYIDRDEIHSLAPEVRDHEPRLALDGGEGGMFFIQKAIREGADHLNPKGWILLEMDPRQILRALEIVDKVKRFGRSRSVKDYSHHDRVLMIQKQESILSDVIGEKSS